MENSILSGLILGALKEKWVENERRHCVQSPPSIQLSLDIM